MPKLHNTLHYFTSPLHYHNLRNMTEPCHSQTIPRSTARNLCFTICYYIVLNLFTLALQYTTLQYVTTQSITFATPTIKHITLQYLCYMIRHHALPLLKHIVNPNNTHFTPLNSTSPNMTRQNLCFA